MVLIFYMNKCIIKVSVNERKLIILCRVGLEALSAH